MIDIGLFFTVQVDQAEVLIGPLGASYNGITFGSGPRYRGSNPCAPAKLSQPGNYVFKT